MLIHLKKPVECLYGVHTSYNMGGGGGTNIKSLVANDETEFEILIFGPIAK